MIKILSLMFPLSSAWMSYGREECFRDEKNKTDVENEEFCPVILYGETNVGKTSLLFQMAISFANDSCSVTYICKQALSKLPLTIHGMQKPDANTLRMVKFLYMNDVKDLIEYCATIHIKSVPPDIIIVDDFEHFCEQSKDNGAEQGAAKLCALLIDTIKFIQSKNKSPSNLKYNLYIGCSDKTKVLPTVAEQFGMRILHLQWQTSQPKKSVSLHSKKSNIKVTYDIQQNEIFLMDFSSVT